MNQRYEVITYLDHLNYYTASDLKRLLTSCGFSKLKIQTTEINLTRLKTSKSETSQAFFSTTSDDEQLRTKIEEKVYLQLAKKLVNGTLTLFGVGDSLKGWFVKR